MFNLDPGKLLIILTVALIVLGPEKLPTFMKQIGKYWTEFQRVRERIQSEMNGAISTITDSVGPLSGAIDLGMSQIKGPLGAAASFLGGSLQSSSIEPSGLGRTSAVPTPAPLMQDSPIKAPSFDSPALERLRPWSAAEGIGNPGIDSDPYLN